MADDGVREFGRGCGDLVRQPGNGGVSWGMSSPAKPRIRSHRDLLVWQRGLLLIKETYRITAGLPKREMYGLTAQMRRAAISIPANVAEGHSRQATRDYIRFLSIANGSLRELDTYCEVCVLVEYLTEQELATMRRLGNETAGLLTRLRQSLVRKLGSG
jgi:four helix bundle protein